MVPGGWQPPTPDDLRVLRWLGVAGAVAAAVDLLKGLSSERPRSLRKVLLHSALIWVLSTGVAALLVTFMPQMGFVQIVGIAAVSAYMGADAVAAIGTRLLDGHGKKRDGTGKT